MRMMANGTGASQRPQRHGDTTRIHGDNQRQNIFRSTAPAVSAAAPSPYIPHHPRSLHDVQSFQSSRQSSIGSTTSVAAGGGITYAAQQQLPRLPIPTLEETLHKFPRVLQALQDEQQQEETQRVCDEFLSGDGPILQQALTDYEREGVANGAIGSYVEEFWNESYLSLPNASVVLNLNPFFVLEDAPDPKTAGDQLKRAASLTFASVKIASLLKYETLPPDVFKGKALCMDQFRALFGSSRQPMDTSSSSSSASTTSSPSFCSKTKALDEVHVYSDSSHVVVLCRNQFYYFPALWPDTGEVAVDEADILDILRAIERHATSSDLTDLVASQTAIGVLTSLPRAEWAKARVELCRLEKNATALHIIDSALFVLVLDDTAPSSIHEAAANMLHGTNRLADDGDTYQIGSCLNRWYDKLQLIICKDGTAGCNFEHSSVDGHTALRFVSDVFAETVISFAETIVDLIHGKGRIQHVVDAKLKRAVSLIKTNNDIALDVYPKKISFDLADTSLDRIYYAETALCDEVSASDTYVLEFRDYGKNLVVGNKMSPDSFVQQSIMLAYYKLYGKVVCTYEPVLTKSFYHGRTEAMRSATPQAKALCETWCSRSSTPHDKFHALRIATIEHSRLVKESACGKGVDRHLFSLKCIAERSGTPVPPFFESEAWQTLNHTILSTSNCGNPALRLFGFGPVVPNGFGVGYIIKEHGFSFSVSSKHRQTQRFVRSLHNTLKEMEQLLTPLSLVDEVKQRPTLKEVKHVVEHAPATYDDIYGESSFIPAPPRSLPPVEEKPHSLSPRERRRRSSKRGSHPFSRVKERQMSFEFLMKSDRHIDFDGEEEEEHVDMDAAAFWYHR